MIVKNITIDNIPAILWGEKSSKIIIAVHGDMSLKSDVPIAVLAEEAIGLGFQVLSFDLPKHGDRKNDPTPYKVQECVFELKKVMEFARLQAESITLTAVSIGAFFSLLAYKDENLTQSLFLSPVVNMERIIQNMMNMFEISEERLCDEKEISTPIGQALYWDYYTYVKNNPVLKWNAPTAILYGKKDNICEFEVVSAFADRFNCKLEVSHNSEHYFYTEEDIKIYRDWVRLNLI